MRNGLRSVGARSNVIACTYPAQNVGALGVDRQHRDHLRHDVPRPEDGWADGDRAPAEFVELRRRLAAPATSPTWASPGRRSWPGGKYLFLPPGHDGDVPDGYFVFQSPTYSNWVVHPCPRSDSTPCARRASIRSPPLTMRPRPVRELRRSIVQRASTPTTSASSRRSTRSSKKNPKAPCDPERPGSWPPSASSAADRSSPTPACATILDQAAASRRRDRPHPAVQAP